jgi:hypothetical protein
MRGPAPPSTDPDIQAALGRIYALFDAPRPRVIEGCPCCIDTRRIDVLLSKPLRALTGDDLRRYVAGAFLTIGSKRDFRYLLPRILELSICDPGALPDVEIVLGTLRLAGWGAWPHEERRAIERLIDLWFDHALACDLLEAEEWIVSSEAESVLCGAARADLDLSPWLARLAEPSVEPVRTALAEWFSKDLRRGRAPGFWEDAPEGWRAMAAVIASNHGDGALN